MATNFNLSRLGVDVNLPTGSTYDLLLVSTPEGYPTGQVHFQFEATPRKITGVQKVAQTFMRVLFTTKGTDLVYPTRGTQFQNLVVGANITLNDSEFRSEVFSAIKDAEAQTKHILNRVSEDKASQLDSISIKGIDTTRDSLSLLIQMRTLAGETAAIAVPFPETDLKISNQ